MPHGRAGLFAANGRGTITQSRVSRSVSIHELAVGCCCPSVRHPPPCACILGHRKDRARLHGRALVDRSSLWCLDSALATGAPHVRLVLPTCLWSARDARATALGDRQIMMGGHVVPRASQWQRQLHRRHAPSVERFSACTARASSHTSFSAVASKVARAVNGARRLEGGARHASPCSLSHGRALGSPDRASRSTCRRLP